MAAGDNALITGLTGQDGSFLAELLLEKGYGVTGVVRGCGARSLGASEHLRDSVQTVAGDLLAPPSLREAIERVRPSEIYHLAAPSFIPASWERPGETIGAIAGSAAAILEAVRDTDPSTRVFVPASGAIFGDAPESPQREQTPCRPNTPYAIAKLAGHQLVGAMRERYGLHASSGITYNHESERRPEQFVTRRVTRGAAAIALGLEEELTLGSLEAVRDWSFAGDIVRGAWMMLQQERADDYVIATGVSHSVRQLVETAFAHAGLDWRAHVKLDPKCIRPAEVEHLIGDNTKARQALGWKPTVDFRRLVTMMVDADLARVASEPAAVDRTPVP